MLESDLMGSPTHTEPPPNVHLRLAALPENVFLVRELLVGISEALDISVETSDDIKTAVTEACNNVVQHAYRDDDGAIEVGVEILNETLEVTVRDHGLGIRPWIRDSNAKTLGVGLMVIEHVARTVELNDVQDGGLEVRMSFDIAGASPLLPVAIDHSSPAAGPPGESDGLPGSHHGDRNEDASSIHLLVSPAQIAAMILPRLLSALATRAHFSTDRISDLTVLGEAVAAHTSKALTGPDLQASVTASPRKVELRVGPLRPSGARQLLASATLPAVGPVIETLTDHCETAADQYSETLILRVLDHRR